jgi:uncharacterized membrane protein YfcA
MSLWAGAPDPSTLAMILAIYAVAGFVKGALGFGLPMVAMSLLVFAGPVEMALALNSVIQPVSNVQQFLGARMVRETARRFWPLLVMLPLGVAVGAWFLTSISEGALLVTIGLFVVTFVLLTVLGITFDIPPRAERPVSFVLGFAAGILGALTAANGPIFVMYLVSLKVDRTQFRAALGMLFLVSGAFLAIGFFSVGVLTPARLVLAVVCMPVALAGMWAGNRLGARLGGTAFRKVVLAALFILGVNFVLRGVGVV